MTVQEWIAAYADAWRTLDADKAAALFTPDGVYQDSPFRDPHRGHDGIRAYWRDTTASQDAVRTRFGEPIVSADERHAAVEFWVTNLNDGLESTLVGILFLGFAADGRCRSLRESYDVTEGHLEPFTTWGS